MEEEQHYNFIVTSNNFSLHIGQEEPANICAPHQKVILFCEYSEIYQCRVI